MKRERVTIIAEGGVNHNGKYSIAKKIISEAKKAGADYIKFQLFDHTEISTMKAKKATYQNKNAPKNENQFEMLKKLSLSKKQMINLYKYSKKKRIGFLLSVFDIKSLEIFNNLNMDFVKIPSGEINNLPLLTEIKKLKQKIILSTGMSTLKEIYYAYKTLNRKRNLITLLHCNSSYPTPPVDVNLKWIKILKNKFKSRVGYSDHTEGFEASLGAVSLGACMIEKHFTLNNRMNGPDHSSSLNPKDFKNMVKSIRKLEQMMVFKKNLVSKSERKNIKIVRKSIVAKINIQKGERFSSLNLTTKRPGNGISPMKWYKILKKKARKKFKKDELIKL